MLGDPIALVTERLRALGQRDRLAQRIARGAAFADGRLIDDREPELRARLVARQKLTFRRM